MTTEVQEITFDEIFRNALDRQIGGRPIDPLDASLTQHKVQDEMLNLIKKHGLLDTLIIDLGICSLCRGRVTR